MTPDDDPRWVECYKLGHAILAMKQAEQLFDQALHTVKQFPNRVLPLNVGLVDAGVIAYARPFSTTRGIGPFRLPGTSLDSSRRQLHDELLDQRRLVVAHPDVDGLLPAMIRAPGGGWTVGHYVLDGSVKQRHSTMYESSDRIEEARELASLMHGEYLGELTALLDAMEPEGAEFAGVAIGRPERVTQVLRTI